MLDLELPPGAGLLGELLQRVDVVEIDFLDLADRRVDVAWHRDIDEKQRSVFPRPPGLFHVRAVDDGMRRTGRGNHHIHPLEHALPIVETHRAAAHFRRQLLRPFERTIGHKDRLRASRDQALRGDPAHLPGTEDHHLAVLQMAENLLRQVHRHVSNGR